MHPKGFHRKMASGAPVSTDRSISLEGEVPVDAPRPGLLARHSGRHGRRRQFLVGEALTIDAQVFADPLDIVARLIERNALDPVDQIDGSVTRIAMRRDPLRDPAWTGI